MKWRTNFIDKVTSNQDFREALQSALAYPAIILMMWWFCKLFLHLSQ